MEDLRAAPEALYHRVLRFLDLPSYSLPHYGISNGNRYPKASPELRALLDDFYRPYNERLSEYLNEDFRWDAGRGLPAREPLSPPKTPTPST